MLRSDIGKDGRRLAAYVRMSLSDVARELGVRPQMIQKYMSGGITQKYIDMVEVMGYDVELKYIKRDDFVRYPEGYSEMMANKRRIAKLKAYYNDPEHKKIRFSPNQIDSFTFSRLDENGEYSSHDDCEDAPVDDSWDD